MYVCMYIFLDFLLLEKKKTKMCSGDSCRSSIFQKDQQNQYKKFDCLVNHIKKCEERQNSFSMCSFYISTSESCASNKGKVEA